MPTIADVDWERLGSQYGDCAEKLRDSFSTGRGYRVSVFAAEHGCSAEDVGGLFDAVAGHGLFTKVAIWVCQQSGDVLDEKPFPDDTECPVCELPYEGKRPSPETQYLVVAPPRRSVPAVLAIHGMNTRGSWQERLGLLLSSMYGRSVPMAIYKYGLIVTGVIIRRRQEALADKFITQLKLVTADLGDRPFGNRPDVIAHSFGTWLLYRALQKDETVRVGHVVLAGCVLPPDARWDQFGDRVGPVLNHYGGMDPWTRVAAYVIPDAGPAGRRGFNEQPGVVQVYEPTFKHSTVFDEDKIEDVFARVWEPFLSSPATDIGNLPAIFAPTHPAGAPNWKRVPRFFRGGIARWVALAAIALLVPLLLAVALPLAAVAVALAIPVAIVFGLVILVGKWRGWDR